MHVHTFTSQVTRARSLSSKSRRGTFGAGGGAGTSGVAALVNGGRCRSNKRHIATLQCRQGDMAANVPVLEVDWASKAQPELMPTFGHFPCQ